MSKAKRFIFKMLTGILLVNAVVAIMVWYSLQRSRDSHAKRAREAAENLSLLLSENITSVFDKTNLGLLAVKDDIESLAVHGHAPPDAIEAILARQRQRLPGVDAFRFADAAGIIRHGTGVERGSATSIANRDYFIRHRDDPKAGLVISKPILGRVTGKWGLNISLRCNNPDGSLGGVVYATILSGHFSDMFGQLALGQKGIISLRDLDFALVARYPVLAKEDKGMGNKAVSSEFLDMVRKDPARGNYVAPTPTDGIDRLFSYRRTTTFPGYITAGLPVEDYMVDWREEALKSVLMGALLFVGTLALGFSVWKAWRLEMTSAEEHSLLARTDTLTGLTNRLAFIEAVEREFQRSRRYGSAAVVLMIDVDHFKRINDTHGHQAGDRALVALATTLKAMARATDLPARIGGEEFVCLLIGADLAGSLEMAERIRTKAAQIRVDSAAGEFGFTVSIGVSPFMNEDAGWSDALHRADQGMYRAKELGRNMVVACSL